MPVPKGVPLAQTDDGVQRVVLQQQGAAGSQPVGPRRQDFGLVRIVHHAEGVDHEVRRPVVGHRSQATVGQ